METVSDRTGLLHPRIDFVARLPGLEAQIYLLGITLGIFLCLYLLIYKIEIMRILIS